METTELNIGAKNVKKIVYIAHCIGAETKKDIEKNLADLRRIVNAINRLIPGTVPFVPYYVDVVSLDDNIPEERERGLSNARIIIQSGIVRECWLTGPRLSDGMQEEKKFFENLGIPVYDFIGML